MLDQHGYDVLEGLGADRSATATQHKPILYSGTSVNPCIDNTDTLTLVLQNNVVPSAVVLVNLFYATGA